MLALSVPYSFCGFSPAKQWFGISPKKIAIKSKFPYLLVFYPKVGQTSAKNSCFIHIEVSLRTKELENAFLT